MSWQWAFYLLWLCEAAQIRSQLGDVSLSKGETVLFSLHDLFLGTDMEFSLSSDSLQAAFLHSDDSCKAVLRVPQKAERLRLGPLFRRPNETQFVLFAAHTVEVWTYSSSSIAKRGSLEVPQAIIGVSAFSEFLVVFWVSAPEGLDVFLMDASATELTATRLDLTFPHQPGDRVQVCSGNTALLFSSAGEHTYYAVDLHTATAVRRPLELSFLEPGDIVDVTCVPWLMVLTEDGCYELKNGIAFGPVPHALGKLLSFDNSASLDKRVAKAERGVWVGDKLLLTKDGTAPYRFLFEHSTLLAHQIVTRDRHFAVSLTLESALRSVRKVLLPVTGEDAAVEVLTANDDCYVLLAVDGSAVQLLSVTFGRTFLGLRGSPSPYEVEICAREDGESVCSRTRVTSVTDEGVLFRRGTVLAPALVSPLGTELFIASHTTEAVVAVSDWVSGANLDISLQFSFIPTELSLEHAVTRSHYSKTASASFALSLSFQRTILLRIVASDIHLYAFSGSQVLFVRMENEVSIMRHETSITGANITACAVTQRGVIVLRSEDGQFYQLESSTVEEIESPASEGFRNMLGNDCDVVVVSEQRVDVYDPMTRRWQAVTEGIAGPVVQVWTADSFLLVLQQDGVLQCYKKWGPAYSLVNTVSLSRNATDVTYSHPHLLVYRSDGLIDVYHTNVLFDVVLTKSVLLGCPFRSFYARHALLVADCGGFLQVMSLTAAQRDAKVFRLKAVRPFFLTANETLHVFDLLCTRETCSILSYKLKNEPRITLRLSVEVLSPNFNSTLLSYGELAVTSEEGNTHTAAFFIAVSNAGGLIRLEQTQVSFEVSWADSLTLNPYAFFSGSSIEFSANTSEAAVQPQLQESHICQLPCSPTSSNLDAVNLFMVCRFTSTVEVYHYSAESFPCKPMSVRRLASRDLACDVFQQVEFLLRRDTILVFFLTGIKSTPHQRKPVFLIFSYDFSSLEVRALHATSDYFEVNSVHLVWERPDLAHIFLAESELLHFSFSWTADQLIVQRESISWPTFSSPRAMGSDLRTDAWLLSVLDETNVLREYSVHTSARLLRTVPCGELLQDAAVSIYGDRVLKFSEGTVDVIRLVDLTLEKRVVLPHAQSKKYRSFFQTSVARAELAYFTDESHLCYIVNITAPRNSEIQGFRTSDKVHFAGAGSLVSCRFTLKNCSILSISEPRITMGASESRRESVDLQVKVSARNDANLVEARIRIHRFKIVPWGMWLSVLCVLLLLALVLALKNRAARNQRPVTIELEARPMNNFSS